MSEQNLCRALTSEERTLATDSGRSPVDCHAEHFINSLVETFKGTTHCARGWKQADRTSTPAQGTQRTKNSTINMLKAQCCVTSTMLKQSSKRSGVAVEEVCTREEQRQVFWREWHQNGALQGKQLVKKQGQSSRQTALQMQRQRMVVHSESSVTSA